MTPMTFEDALDDDRAAEHRTVLLGNGFSRAFSEDFAYTRLRDVAEMPGLTVDRDRLFTQVGSDDFETVMDRLRGAADLAALYAGGETELSATLRHDAEVVQRGLVDAISAIHPATAAAIPAEEYARTAIFLSSFERIFTVNYDLLLYWAVLHAETVPVPRTDGFLRPGGGPLRWVRPRRPDGQSLFYLHGAVHLVSDADVVHKLAVENGRSLVEQLLANLAEGRYPLVVTEGSRADKEARIARSRYLTYCHEQLASTVGSLFVHGLSLSENDGHLLDALTHRESGIDRIYVGVHDGPRSSQVRERAAGLEARRAENGGAPVRVTLYDAGSAHVWR